MGGLWVDYELMTTIPGLFAIGEPTSPTTVQTGLAPAHWLQGAGDGYFILPYTITKLPGPGNMDNGWDQTDLLKIDEAERMRLKHKMTDVGL
ncbi:MAG: hypothetical protein R2758_15350 [Bacteroidales bacterium]